LERSIKKIKILPPFLLKRLSMEGNSILTSSKTQNIAHIITGKSSGFIYRKGEFK
jgi:hypothetical protein